MRKTILVNWESGFFAVTCSVNGGSAVRVSVNGSDLQWFGENADLGIYGVAAGLAKAWNGHVVLLRTK